MPEQILSEKALLEQITTDPNSVTFQQVISTIDATYDYTPTTFCNGIGEQRLENTAGTNEGSCKIFAFANIHDLDSAQTLACFGDFYRVDVLLNLGGKDHGNIRNFLKYGWDGIAFDDGFPLQPKRAS